MLKINKYRNLMLAIILISLVAIIQGADEPAIDINEITKSNPFMQFTPNQNRAPIGAAITVKPDLFVDTATLKFLDAKSVKATISSMSGEYGSMEPDSKGNTLIICDTNENVEKILEQIRKIDRKPDQVMIEVVLVDVKLNNATELGINWDMLTAKDQHEAVFRQNLGFTDRLGSTERTATDTINTIGNATAFNTTGTGSDLWLLFGGDIRSVIHAIQQKNNVEILASPRVMVVSGQTASIEAVEEIPYSEISQTSEGGSLTSTKFKNVGVMLNIGATLTDDKFILLNVETEQNAYTGELNAVPTVDTRKVVSSLLLEDGQVLVIGGLRQKKTQKQTYQLPILGDLPIVGLAFKSTKTTENNSELLIILSPHIYDAREKLNV
ncbi:MAG: hypothetical protein KJ757_06330, partial [Planctomycetes bacterium]|nr:hypothetical protein [Planctomycetota bacterium]